MDNISAKEKRFIKKVSRFSILHCNSSISRHSFINHYAYYRLSKLFKKIDIGAINKAILLKLLDLNNPKITLSVASNMLMFAYETEKAMDEIYNIGKSKYDKPELMVLCHNAQISYYMFKTYGYFPVSSKDFELDFDLLHKMFDN